MRRSVAHSILDLYEHYARRFRVDYHLTYSWCSGSNNYDVLHATMLIKVGNILNKTEYIKTWRGLELYEQWKREGGESYGHIG